MVRNNGGRDRQTACSEGYSEQDWAEYALGGWDAASRAAMDWHRERCAACEDAYAEWQMLTAPPDAVVDRSPRPYPSERTRLSLLRAVRRRAWRTGLLRAPVRMSLAAAVCCLLLFGFWIRSSIGPADPEAYDAYVSSREPNAVTVMQASDSLQYRVMPAAGGQSGGYVWLSADVSEALLLLEGLPFVEQADYQAWAVTGQRQDSLGILKLTGSRGHLHVRSPLLREADTISLSAEPKGGSASPTSEQMVLVLFGDSR